MTAAPVTAISDLLGRPPPTFGVAPFARFFAAGFLPWPLIHLFALGSRTLELVAGRRERRMRETVHERGNLGAPRLVGKLRPERPRA